jgi:hypothetical protein
MKLEEPCEGRLSSTVPWERKGETPLRDPITSKPKTTDSATLNRQKKMPAAHFSTFGFARHTSQSFAKPKELKFPHST